MSLELYTADTPNGKKISIALEEMGLEYVVRPVDISGNVDQFTPEFKAISPNSKIPAIVDFGTADGGPPQAIFESGAILLYLAQKTRKFLPLAPREVIACHEWLFWQIGGFGPMAGQVHHFLGQQAQEGMHEKVAYSVARYQKEVHRLYGVMDERLRLTEYFAGSEYTIADMAIL
jgi:GST-like protein